MENFDAEPLTRGLVLVGVPPSVGEQLWLRRCRRRLNHRDLRGGGGDPEVEDPLLVIGQQPVGFLDEQTVYSRMRQLERTLLQ